MGYVSHARREPLRVSRHHQGRVVIKIVSFSCLELVSVRGR